MSGPTGSVGLGGDLGDPGGSADGPDGPTTPPFRVRHDGVFGWRSLAAARSVLASLVGRQLRARYKHTRLGFAWALIGALLPLTILVFIRGRLTGGTGRNSVLFVYLGLFCWQFFASGAADGANSLIADSAILTRVRCDRRVFPLSRVLVSGFDAVTAGGVIFAFLALRGDFHVAPAALLAPFFLLIVVAQTIGAALALSVLVVQVRDLRPLIGLIFGLGLFLAPILWTLESLTPPARVAYVVVNPLGAVIEALRAVLAQGAAPPWDLLLIAAVSAAVMLCVGMALFRRRLPLVVDLA